MGDPIASESVYRVKLFGVQARDMGTRELAVSLPAAEVTAERVLEALREIDPMLHGSLAVDHQVASPGQAVLPGQELALIGMVSGG